MNNDRFCQLSIVLMKKKILRSNLRERVVAQLLRRNCSSLARRKAIAPARRLVLFPKKKRFSLILARKAEQKS